MDNKVINWLKEYLVAKVGYVNYWLVNPWVLPESFANHYAQKEVV